jgi:hypothetical protein
MSQVMWMWHDVRRGDDDQDVDLDAQLRSPDYTSPQSSGDERDACNSITRRIAAKFIALLASVLRT